MSKRKLPAAAVVARPGVQTTVLPSAMSRWNPAVRSAADDEPDNTISVLDVIGADWYGEGVTAKRIAAALRAIGKRDVVVNINSPGGDYFEGLAIYNMLREHPGKVTARVMGLAASAASVIAMAGDEVKIARAGFLMIHNTWVAAIGDRHQLREVSDWLEPFDAVAADIYAARTGLKQSDVANMMDRETWIGGADAVDDGFADSFLSADDVSVKSSIDAREVHALRELEMFLAKARCPRSKRRELVSALKNGGMPGAVATGLRDAAVTEGLESLLSQARSI